MQYLNNFPFDRVPVLLALDKYEELRALKDGKTNGHIKGVLTIRAR